MNGSFRVLKKYEVQYGFEIERKFADMLLKDICNVNYFKNTSAFADFISDEEKKKYTEDSSLLWGYIDEYNEEWVECSPELIKFLISAYEAGYERDNFVSEDECKQYIATLKGILDGYDTNNNFIRIEYV